jgi:hypothetical protein
MTVQSSSPVAPVSFVLNEAVLLMIRPAQSCSVGWIVRV